jgi:molybdate transport system substrate-binding protein
MKMKRFVLIIGSALTLLLVQTATTSAAEIKVISTIGVRTVVEELAPQFEQKTGNKLAITFGVSNVLKRQIEAGEPFDLAIMTASVADDLIKQGNLVSATRTDIARGSIGIAVRAGAAKPDIGTVEALKQALLNAKSIANSKEGASGIYFDRLLERWGIAEQMKPKIKYGTGAVAELVANGEAELAVQLINELIAVKGVELVGPLPAEVQNYVVLTGGVGSNAKQPEQALDFLKFLRAPAAVPVIKAKGLEPAW